MVNNFFHFDYDIYKILLFSFIHFLIETFSEIDDNISIPISIIVLDVILNNLC